MRYLEIIQKLDRQVQDSQLILLRLLQLKKMYNTVNYTCQICEIYINEVENQDQAGSIMCKLCFFI